MTIIIHLVLVKSHGHDLVKMMAFHRLRLYQLDTYQLNAYQMNVYQLDTYQLDTYQLDVYHLCVYQLDVCLLEWMVQDDNSSPLQLEKVPVDLAMHAHVRSVAGDNLTCLDWAGEPAAIGCYCHSIATCEWIHFVS